ncbi:MAG: hypothetical protein DRP15_01680 [Candidatus Aenigmatarchaeota archaeon]|nr:MAG: hypothetical protein DRP15_01680 [Candidatus Aenigmarchaeota archaeon]
MGVFLEPMKFLLDTNILMSIESVNIDLGSELSKFGKPELYTLDVVKKELIKKSNIQAKIALEFIKRFKVKVIKSSGQDADSEIVRTASEKGFVVCTQDKALIKRLVRKGVKVVYIRQKRFLEMF